MYEVTEMMQFDFIHMTTLHWCCSFGLPSIITAEPLVVPGVGVVCGSKVSLPSEMIILEKNV